MDGRIRRRSQWIFLARSSEVEREVGRIIHRTTRDMTSGFRVSLCECRVVRKEGIVSVRERRWIAQTGILKDGCEESR